MCYLQLSGYQILNEILLHKTNNLRSHFASVQGTLVLCLLFCVIVVLILVSILLK